MIATTPSASGAISRVRADLSGALQPPLSEKEMSEKIRSIDAVEIDLIGMKIIEKVLNNLGSVRAACVMEQKKETDRASVATMRQVRACAGMEVESGKKQFLSDEETRSFINVALCPIKDELATSFAAFFLGYGMYFKVSDYEPTGFLAKTAKETGINITLNDVPPKYFIFLKIDKEQTREKSDLVFVLTEESQEVEFSRETFTLSELTAEFETVVREELKSSLT